MRIERRVFIFTVVLLLCLPFLACPWDKKDDAEKVSDIVKGAKAFATTYVAMGAADEIVDILTQDGTVSQPQAQTIFKASERIRASLDRVRDSINAGVWDEKQLEILLDNALAEVAKLQTDLGIKNPESAARFQEYISLLRYGIASAAQIVKALKPLPAPTTPNVIADSKRDPNAQSLTTSQITQIIGVSTVAAIKVVQIRSETHAEPLWNLAAQESKTIQAANAQRIK